MKNLRHTQVATKNETSELYLAIDRAVFADFSRNAALGDSLTVLCQSVEEQCPGLLCSILTLNKKGTHLAHGAAPSLPQEYIDVVNGSAIGPMAGSCGTAAFRRAPVAVTDISSDPLWTDYRHLVLKHGLRACWSTPIASATGEILGTFAVYYRESRGPNEREGQLINWAVPLAAIAIERNQSNDALRNQREELQTILDATPAMIWYKDKENRVLRANRAAAESTGLRAEQLVGRSTHDICPEEAANYYKDDLEVIRTGRAKRNIHECMYTPAGEKRWLITDKFPYRDSDGEVIGVIVFCRDVTDQHHAETAQNEAEGRLRTLVEQLPAVTYVCGYGPGTWFYISPQIEKLLGIPASDWLSDPHVWVNHLHPEDRDRVLAEEASSMTEKKSFIAEYRMIARDGRVVWIQDQAKVLPAVSGQPLRMQGVMLDITESKRHEEALQKSEVQLRTAQKMEAVGRLAGGIAHDFNNLLMIINGQLELLDEQVAAQPESHRKIEQALKAVDRAAALTRQLLAFSRLQVLQPRVLNLNLIVTEISKLFPPLIGENILLSLRLHDELGSVKADPSQIEQIILNLVVNARDAMPRGGTLVVETANVEIDQAFASTHPPVTPGRFVLLSVTDTGVGMDAETQARIFEPFFTTKEKGKGTGLGLATVYGVVKQSNGFIWVDSKPGQGASFKIYLPEVAESPEAMQSNQGNDQIPLGSETILLVEDEDDVREVAREFLLQGGYKVLEAKNGAEAVEIASTHPGCVDLLLTDMAMPGISGSDLANRVAQLRPEIKIIYMSGYVDITSPEQDKLGPSTRLLPKPFSRNSLSRVVRQALDE
jgi:PAS domain S-box-containing protein